MIRHLLDRLRDRAGTAAIEFALVLPILMTLLLGTYEGTQALLAYMKLVSASQTVADLVTQQQQVASSDFPNFYVAGQLVMSPLPGGVLGVAITNVTVDSSGTASVLWHEECGGITPISNAVTLASGYAGKSESVIIVQANYAYTSLLHYVMPSAITLTQISYSKPRVVASIPYKGTATACS